MKEQFPLPPPENDTNPDVTGGTRNIGAVPELIQEKKQRPPLPPGTVIEPDMVIDLTAPDAVERLGAHDRDIAPRPDRHRDNEYPTPEELAQEEKDDAERDAEDKKDPLLEAYKGPPGGLTDAQAKKIRDENSAGRYDEDEWDEPTKSGDEPKKTL